MIWSREGTGGDRRIPCIAMDGEADAGASGER